MATYSTMTCSGTPFSTVFVGGGACDMYEEDCPLGSYTINEYDYMECGWQLGGAVSTTTPSGGTTASGGRTTTDDPWSAAAATTAPLAAAAMMIAAVVVSGL